MTNFVSGNFAIPDGFTEEQIEGQLYHEDLDEDDEIWLIRMSSDIELSALDRKKICLSDHSCDVNVKNIKTENGKLLESYAENCEVPNLCVLLPHKKDERLHVVKKVIKGTILISEGLAFGEDAEIKSEIEDKLQESSTLESTGKKDKKKKQYTHNFDNSDLNYETKDTLQENTLVSTLESTRKKSKKKKQSAHNFDNSDLNYETEDKLQENTLDSTLESTGKKDKKKKQFTYNFDNSDLNYETEDAETVSSNIHKKRVKKHSDARKKKNSDGVEVKNETHSMDWDGFPPCVSQK